MTKRGIGGIFGVFLAVMLSLCLLDNKMTLGASNKVICEYMSDGTLVISGKGMLQWEHLEASAKGEMGKGVTKLVVEEGITGIESYCFSSDYGELEEVELPGTLSYIGKKAFKDCKSLQAIVIPVGVAEISEGCFEGCDNLMKITIPSTVSSIQTDAFAGCERLCKLVLPESLEQWNDPITNTPMLKKIKNRSGIECELNDCEKNKTWYVGKKKRNTVPAGKVAKAKGKKYKIQYKLLGGKKKGKLPTSYEYGSNMKLPTNVKKKGYVLLGWYNEAELNPYYCTRISPSLAEKITLQPFWVKYKVKNIKGQQLQISIDDSNAVAVFGNFAVRYSRYKDMSNARVCTDITESEIKIIVDQQKNEKCYVEISYVDPEDSDNERVWVGKRSVKIRK